MEATQAECYVMPCNVMPCYAKFCCSTFSYVVMLSMYNYVTTKWGKPHEYICNLIELMEINHYLTFME